MNSKKDKIDWSKGCWREMLIYQRKSMWREDTLDKLAVWMGIRPGLTAVDVGCGLGYLGYTYWRYFGEGGRYVGVDREPKLLRDAAEAARDWAVGGEADFIVGDAYRIPLPDDFADWVMCQTLFLHLEEPSQALREMIRITRPGGLIMCKEPDNLSSVLVKGFWSMPEMSLEEELLVRKKAFLCAEGRRKLGRGDLNIAPKIPHMMKKQGLVGIDARLNDNVFCVEPPYEDELMQRRLEKQKRFWLDEETYKTWMATEKEEFLAAGGDPEEYARCEKLSEKFRPVYIKQTENGEFFSCVAGSNYVIIGRKPV
ncbi:MAG: methyltransferase domain-containing protein [candidate division Zixibacteria bacterium]|nr:methyltransferase domain-containing protein [candidate division Zixibacteria bacterium]